MGEEAFRLMGPVLLARHGQSSWNSQGRYTGWTDVPLTDLGYMEAVELADSIERCGWIPDRIYTSMLRRALSTAEIVAERLGLPRSAVVASWRLNERHMGVLQGMTKQQVADTYGRRQAKAWRRGEGSEPPAMEEKDLRHPRWDPIYSGVPRALLPSTENIATLSQRMLPYWYGTIAAELKSATVMIVGHSDVICALGTHLGLDEQAARLPNGGAIATWLEGPGVAIACQSVGANQGSLQPVRL